MTRPVSRRLHRSGAARLWPVPVGVVDLLGGAAVPVAALVLVLVRACAP